MAYRAPTAVNRAYAKVPIGRPRTSVHVLVPTPTLRRPALKLTGSLGSSLHRGFESFLCFYLLRAPSSAETSIEGKKILGGRMPIRLLVVSRMLPVLMREGRGTFDCGAYHFLVLLVLGRPRSPFLIRPASASLPKGDDQEEAPNRGQSAQCCDDLA
jgi:hypothetical protein